MAQIDSTVGLHDVGITWLFSNVFIYNFILILQDTIGQKIGVENQQTKALMSSVLVTKLDLHSIVLNSSKMKLGTWASATFRKTETRNIHLR